MGSATSVGRRSFAPLRLAASVGLVLVISLVADRVAAQAPEHVYLTWRGNTSTTMTVNAQTVRAVREVEVRFDTESRRRPPAGYRNVVRGEAHRIEGLADGRWVHWMGLTGLEPGRARRTRRSKGRNYTSSRVAVRMDPEESPHGPGQCSRRDTL